MSPSSFSLDPVVEDIDGDEALNDTEFGMLWMLLTERKLLIGDGTTKLSANSAHFVFGSRLDWLGGKQGGAGRVQLAHLSVARNNLGVTSLTMWRMRG